MVKWIGNEIKYMYYIYHVVLNKIGVPTFIISSSCVSDRNIWFSFLTLHCVHTKKIEEFSRVVEEKNIQRTKELILNLDSS